MAPNMSTAVLEKTSSAVSELSPATPASIDPAASRTVRSTSALRSATARRVSSPTSSPAFTPSTPTTMARYQPSTRSGSASTRPSARAMAATASGPANSLRRSARGAVRFSGLVASVSTSCRAVDPVQSSKPSRTAACWNGGANGARWRVCSSPSVESIDGPTTWAVENRGSSTV